MALWQLLEHQQTCETQGPLERSLKNGWINARPVEICPINFEASVRILGQAILVRRRTASQVDSVDLSCECTESSGTSPNLLAVIGNARTVDIEAGNNLGDRVVKTEDNLDMAGWVLRDNGDGILRANGRPRSM
jgi:hypothetical protein